MTGTDAFGEEIWPRVFDPRTPRRIILSGTGRAGTTFLVQVFTALGFDTGFTLDYARNSVDSISKAGLEHARLEPGGPYVVKSPWFAGNLGAQLDASEIEIAWAIVPMRDLFGAAESRRRVHAEAAAAGRNTSQQRGALMGTTEPEQQEQRLALSFHKLIHTLAVHRIPILFPTFPRLVMDPAYCFDSLRPLLARHGVTGDEFERAHQAMARPQLIHDFTRAAPR